MPPVQPLPPMQPGGVTPGGAMMGGPSGARGPGGAGPMRAPNGMPMVQQVQLPPEKTKDVAGLVKTIVIVVLAMILVVFIGLFIWKMVENDELVTTRNSAIDMAVAEAEDAVRVEEAKKYAEQKKYPYESFTGPTKYGQVSFEYPKTWNVYIESDASDGGDFEAYFAPQQVDTVGEDSSIYALRMTISTQPYEDIIEDLQDQVDDDDVEFDVERVDIVNEKTGKKTSVQKYTGTLPDTEDFNGYIVVYQIRDKTVILQTDSVKFKSEYDKLLGTMTYNE